MFKKVVVPLVGAEGDKSRRRKIPFLVRSQMDWVEGQLSRDSVDICKFTILQEIYVAEEKKPMYQVFGRHPESRHSGIP